MVVVVGDEEEEVAESPTDFTPFKQCRIIRKAVVQSSQIYLNIYIYILYIHMILS